MNSDEQHNADTTPVIRVAPETGADVRRRALRRGHVAEFVQGRLPRGSGWAQRHVSRLLKLLEAELVKRHRELSPWQRAVLQSCGRHEARALLLQQLLRKRADEITVSEVLAVTAAITNSSDRRDRCLRALSLDRVPSVLDMLYGQRGATP